MQFSEGNSQTAALPPQFTPNMEADNLGHNNNPAKASLRKQNIYKASKNAEIISIPTDQEEKHQFERSMFQSHFKYEISKAQLTGSTFDKLFAIMKYLQIGATLKEKEEKAKNYIRQFFFTRMNMNVEKDYFIPRVDAGLLQNPGLIYEKRYLIYGIDLLTIRQIINNYSFKNPTKKFLDSSHLLLEFTTNQQGWRFLEYRVIHFNKSLLVPMEQNPNVLARNWVELSSYGELIFDRRQFIRNFTEADEKYFAGRPTVVDHYRVYQQAKKQLIDTIKETPQIKKIYEEITNEQENEKRQSKGYRSFIRDKKRFMRGNDRFAKMNSSSNSGEVQSQSSSKDRLNYNGYNKPRYNPQHIPNRQAEAFRQYPEKCGLDKIVYTGNPRNQEYIPPEDMANYKSKVKQTRKQYDQHMRKGPFFKENCSLKNQNSQDRTNIPPYSSSNYQKNNFQQPNHKQMNGARQNARYFQQGYLNHAGNFQKPPAQQNIPFINPSYPTNGYPSSSQANYMPPVPQVQTIRKTMLDDLQSQKSNSHYNSLQLELQDFQLFSGQMSSINEHSKHQISHINQPQFSFHNESSSCNLNSDFTHSNMHMSSQQNASSVLEIEHENPDFKQHFSDAIENIANKGSIKEEPEDEKEIEDLLMNVSKKDQQIESEESSSWNLNLQQEPIQPSSEKDIKKTSKEGQNQDDIVVNLDEQAE